MKYIMISAIILIIGIIINFITNFEVFSVITSMYAFGLFMMTIYRYINRNKSEEYVEIKMIKITSENVQDYLITMKSIDDEFGKNTQQFINQSIQYIILIKRLRIG